MFASPLWRRTALESAALGLLCALDGAPNALEDFENQATALCESAFASVAVEPTLLLLKAIWRPGTRDDLSHRALLATAIVRYVDVLANASRNGVSAKSIKHLCLDENLPEDVVEVRHQIAHKDLPQLSTLQMAARMAFEHVVNSYWRTLVTQSHIALPDDRGLEADLRLWTQVVDEVSRGLSGCQLTAGRRAEVSRAMNTLKPPIEALTRNLSTVMDLGGSTAPVERFLVDFLLVSYSYKSPTSPEESSRRDETDVVRYSVVKMLSSLPPWAYKRIVGSMCARIGELADEYGTSDIEQSHGSWCVLQSGRGWLNRHCECMGSDCSIGLSNLLSWLWGLHFSEGCDIEGGALWCSLSEELVAAGRESVRRNRTQLLRAWVQARLSKSTKADWHWMNSICAHLAASA